MAFVRDSGAIILSGSISSAVLVVSLIECWLMSPSVTCNPSYSSSFDPSELLGSSGERKKWAFPFGDPAPEREREPAMSGVSFDVAPTSLESISARRTTAGCGADALQTGC